MNRKYGKLENGAITYAPDMIDNGVALLTMPSAEDYAAAGWKEVVDTRPTSRIGFDVEPVGYAESEDKIVRIYNEHAIEPPPPPVVRYSKLKLIVAAKQAGKWSAFKAFIASAGLEDEWAACQFLASNYPQFENAKAAIIAAGIATDEEIEEILAASVDEEV